MIRVFCIYKRKSYKIILYARFFGNLGWRSQAKRYGVKNKLKNKPYASSHEVEL